MIVAVRFMLALGMLAVLFAPRSILEVGRTQEKMIAMTPVRYDGLKQEVCRQRGKVVLVDFWAGFCFPCRKAFPRFIEMQKKYADKGFVVITVSVDTPDDPHKLEMANVFLRQVHAPFLNLLLNEPPDAWTKKLNVGALPCYYVFDRQAKWIRFGGDSEKGVDYDELEKTIAQLLDEK